MAALLVCWLGCSGDGVIQERHQGSLEASDPVLKNVDASHYDAYPFHTKAGYLISLSLQSDAFDPYLHLFDANGNQLAYNDDVATGNDNARIDLTAPYTGNYFVLANSRDAGEVGAYILEVETVPPGMGGSR